MRTGQWFTAWKLPEINWGVFVGGAVEEFAAYHYSSSAALFECLRVVWTDISKDCPSEEPPAVAEAVKTYHDLIATVTSEAIGGFMHQHLTRIFEDESDRLIARIHTARSAWQRRPAATPVLCPATAAELLHLMPSAPLEVRTLLLRAIPLATPGEIDTVAVPPRRPTPSQEPSAPSPPRQRFGRHPHRPGQ
jgi:hypothetical protein